MYFSPISHTFAIVINNTNLPKLFVCIPVLNELENIPELLNNISRQNYRNFKVIVCVNQPETWWNEPEKHQICIHNQKTLKLLNTENRFQLSVIDKSSPGKGWVGKKHGVGWARKVAMDLAIENALPTDIILSMDADTAFTQNYFEAIATRMNHTPKAMALSVPYMHPLSGNEALDRLMLRYEIYMRHYALSLWIIENPYAFTAIGSAMAIPVWAYKKVNGISPVLSGEDFYFMLKLSKSGAIIHTCKERIYPQGRLSNRVYFGTGPALMKGNSGDWSSYPIYPQSLFQKIKESFQAFELLWEKDTDFPMDSFLAGQFKDAQWWIPLRANYKNKAQFVKACCVKTDALRILQYLKAQYSNQPDNDEKELIAFMQNFYGTKNIKLEIPELNSLNFKTSNITLLKAIRQKLMQSEDEFRAKHDNNLHPDVQK